MKTILLQGTFLTLLAMNSFAQNDPQDIQVKLNHIAISVTDLQESEQFYRDIIGLEQIPEPFNVGRHAWFNIGQGSLHVIKASEERVEHNKSNHLCFSVGDLDGFMKKLSSHGVEYADFAGNTGEINLRPDGVRQIYFTDPDGHWIEVNDEF
ncbi:MAG: VOC family protein [Balneolales bacterium]